MENPFAVNLETCNRTGICLFRHPELFAEGEDGYPVPVSPLADDQRSTFDLEEVLGDCPTGSIRLRTEQERAPGDGTA